MGFFQELKEDLSQAVNELVPDGEPDTQQVELQETDRTEDKEMEAAQNIEEEAETVSVEEPENAKASAWDEETPKQTNISPDQEASEELSTITKGMIINGNMESEGSLDLVGTVNGNIMILGKLNITGSITGNSQAAEIYAQDANVVGDVTSMGSVKIGNNSVIRGNIYATSAVIAGAVKGDIDVKGPVILDSSAIVMGNIKSKAVQINNGAVIEGMCSQCYADVSPASFFKD